MWPFGFRRFKRPRSAGPVAGLKIPRHLAVIMDGNGRWAALRGLPRSAGHRVGAEKLRDLCAWSGDLGISYLTVYAFSTENWSRPSDEVHSLMDLFIEFFERFDPELEKEGIRVRFTGDIPGLPPRLQDVIGKAESNSLLRNRMQLIVAFNYGGRREIANAVKAIARLTVSGAVSPDEISEELLSRHMYLPDIPDPDLIIRPSGELRLSNFLLWESAYAELWFDKILWPDFTRDDLLRAIRSYTARDRRFGKVDPV